LRYVEARIESLMRDEAYRAYMAKSLQLIPQNKYITTSYFDLFDKKQDKKPELSGDEIVEDIMARAGLHFR